MDQQHVLTLTAQLGDLFREGKPEAVRQFLADHYEEFPKEVQEKIAVLFTTEALNRSATATAAAAAVQEETARQVETVHELREEAERKAKALELEGRLPEGS